MSAEATNEAERLGILGRTITGIYVGTDEESMVLDTDMGRVVWATDADCCSTTWFADIKGTANLIGHRVLAATRVQYDDPEDGRTRQEVDSVESIKITTDAGEAEVIWRNSSNGYYGGSVYWPDDAALPEWYHVEPPDLSTLTAVTADWQAPAQEPWT